MLYYTAEEKIEPRQVSIVLCRKKQCKIPLLKLIELQILLYVNAEVSFLLFWYCVCIRIKILHQWRNADKKSGNCDLAIVFYEHTMYGPPAKRYCFEAVIYIN